MGDDLRGWGWLGSRPHRRVTRVPNLRHHGVASSESPRPNGPDPHLSDYTPAIEFALAVTVALYIAVHLAGVLTRGRSRRTREVFQAVTGIGVGMAALVVVALLLANKPWQTAAALGVASPGAAPQAVPWPPDSASSDGS